MKKLNKNRKLIALISIITIIIIIGVIISANIIKTNIANEKYKSSNENSNNENLIPEYIKKGITLGGVTGTLESLDTSDATAKPEDILFGKTAYVDGKKITGTKVTKDVLKIGDYVEYTPDTANAYSLTTNVTGYKNNQTIQQEALKWQILNINEDGTVDLISATQSTASVGLGSALGYNNGVYLLNDICKKLYSNSSLGVTARSLNSDDVESYMTEEGLEYARSGWDPFQETAWGKTYTPVYGRYPKLYARENGSGIGTTNVKKDGIERSDSYYTQPTTETTSEAGNNRLTVTQTNYESQMSSNNYKNEEIFNLIHCGGTYWLASRCVGTYGYDVWFGITGVSDNLLSGISCIRSEAVYEHGRYARSIRPVVKLLEDIKFIGGNGSADNGWKIST